MARGGARKGAGRKKGIGISNEISKHCEKFIKEILKDDAIRFKATKQLSLSLELQESEDFFYVIENNGLYKLGYSSNFKRRYKNYKTHLGNVNVVFVTKEKDCFGLEKYMHNLFDSKRTTGEWFKLSEKDLLEIVSYCSNKHFQ